MGAYPEKLWPLICGRRAYSGKSGMSAHPENFHGIKWPDDCYAVPCFVKSSYRVK